MKKSTQVFIIVLTLLLSVAFPVFAKAIIPADSPPSIVPEAVLLLIPVLVGSLGIPVINFFKNSFGWTKPEDKQKNIWLAFGVSLILAVFALAITNSFLPMTGPNALVAWITLAFSVATLIYKSLPSAEPTNG